MGVHWYPGHMVKAEKRIKENMSLVDMVIELRDARAPRATSNPRLGELSNKRPRLVILNKADLAIEKKTNLWLQHLKTEYYAIKFNSTHDKGQIVVDMVNEMAKSIKMKRQEKGLRPRPVRTMVLGVPNVGKSSFINRIARRSSMKTGQKPGVTRGYQWLKVSKEIELLDTPGVLWPKFKEEDIGLHLAWIGSISDNVFDKVEVALALIRWFATEQPSSIIERFETIAPLGEPIDILKIIGIKKGCLLPGGKVDYEKTAHIFLSEFRSGLLGKVTLENPV